MKIISTDIYLEHQTSMFDLEDNAAYQDRCPLERSGCISNHILIETGSSIKGYSVLVF